jgi:hypothetical protein
MKIRAHHLLCLHTISGDDEGYSKAFIENMKRIAEKIKKDPDTEIKVIKDMDDICRACPNNKGICMLKPGINKWIIRHDEKVLSLTGLKVGQTYKAIDIFPLVKKKIKADDIPAVCRGCIWLKEGCAEEYRKGMVL